MFLIEFKWPIVLVSVMELPDCLWVLAVSFSACEDFFNYNSWEKLLIARRNIELKSCITEFWSSDKWRKQVLWRYVGALFCVVSKPHFEVYRETTHRPNNSCCTASYPLHGTQTVRRIPVWCKERIPVVSILKNKQTVMTFYQLKLLS